MPIQKGPANLGTGSVDSTELSNTLDLSAKTVTYRTIVAGDIASNAITTAKVADTAITPAKMANSGAEFGMRNRIINGDMRIDQRFAGAATTNAINDFVVDRWVVGQTTTGKLIAQQNLNSLTPPPGFTTYLGVTSQSAYSIGSSDIFRIYQTLEGYNIADFGWGTANAITATLSFWVRSSLTGLFGGAFNNAAGRYPFSYTINSANTWEYKTITIVGSTTLGAANITNGSGISIQFSLGTGTTYSGTAGVWSATNYLSATGTTSVVGTNGATFYITGVQLEKGSTATSFDYRPFGTELALCQRYFTKSQSWAAAVTAGEGQGLIAWNAVTTAVIAGWAPHKVSMRTQPTITIYRQDGTINATNRFTDGVNTTGTATCPEPGIEGFRYVSNASSGFTAGTYYQFYYTASAEL
jgi:hypothetical protein